LILIISNYIVSKFRRFLRHSVEAYEHSLSARAAASIDQDGGRTKSHPQNVFSVTGSQDDSADENAVLLKCVEQLEKALERATRGIGAARALLPRRLVLSREPVHGVHRSW